MADCAKRMMGEKSFARVFPLNIFNDTIEICFCGIRNMSRLIVQLSIESFFNISARHSLEIWLFQLKIMMELLVKIVEKLFFNNLTESTKINF